MGFDRLSHDSQDTIHDIAPKYIDSALSDPKRKQVYRLAHQSEWCESLMEILYTANKFNDLETKSNIVDCTGGGVDSVTVILTMALFLLASNPSEQEKLYQEICQVIKDETDDRYGKA